MDISHGKLGKTKGQNSRSKILPAYIQLFFLDPLYYLYESKGRNLEVGIGKMYQFLTLNIY